MDCARIAHEVINQMSTQEVFVQQFARLFEHYQEALTLSGGNASGLGFLSWQDLPQAERERMVAAARLALLELEANDREDPRRWYARPGDAEWGC